MADTENEKNSYIEEQPQEAPVGSQSPVSGDLRDGDDQKNTIHVGESEQPGLDSDAQSSSGDGQAAEQEAKPIAMKPASRWLLSSIESMLFAAGDVVAPQSMLEILLELQPDLTVQALRQAVEQLRVELREAGRGVRIVEVAGGYQMRTSSDSAEFVRKLLSKKPPRMTRATLETLAIVAYRQPVTRGETEEIRGVDCGAVMKHLLEKKLIKIIGRKEEAGRPLLYGTTKEFLSYFSLKDLSSLPTLKDFTELSDEHRASLGLKPSTPLDEPKQLDVEQASALEVEATDAYTPVGDDEVVQELADVLATVKAQDRQLCETFFQPNKETKEPKVSDNPCGDNAEENSTISEESEITQDRNDWDLEESDTESCDSDKEESNGG